MSWKDDISLKDDLSKYVKKNLKRAEILDYVIRDYSFHFNDRGSCSLRTLGRMLAYFNITYTDYNVKADDVMEAVRTEMAGAGKDLGYRAMTLKVRQEHDLNVPRDIVYAAMSAIDQEPLEKRRPVFKKKKRNKQFTTEGVNNFLSIDGHDKLMGFQNSTFPIAIYGIMDQASRKILMLKCWVSNSDPLLIGRWYIDWLKDHLILARNIRLDRGTETGKLVTIHAYLRGAVGELDDPMECIFYGPSTSNQIERWWRELHERLEKSLKSGLNNLLRQGLYNPHEELDRNILAFIMIPLVQKELDVFKTTIWNSHRIRRQHKTLLPDGVPDHIYDFPERYGLAECGYNLTTETIAEVEKKAGVYDSGIDFLDKDFRKQCEEIIPYPADIGVKDFQVAYEHLKNSITRDN